LPTREARALAQQVELADWCGSPAAHQSRQDDTGLARTAGAMGASLSRKREEGDGTKMPMESSMRIQTALAKVEAFQSGSFTYGAPAGRIRYLRGPRIQPDRWRFMLLAMGSRRLCRSRRAATDIDETAQKTHRTISGRSAFKLDSRRRWCL